MEEGKKLKFLNKIQTETALALYRSKPNLNTCLSLKAYNIEVDVWIDNCQAIANILNADFDKFMDLCSKGGK